jgi:hypothetical protein
MGLRQTWQIRPLGIGLSAHPTSLPREHTRIPCRVTLSVQAQSAAGRLYLRKHGPGGEPALSPVLSRLSSPGSTTVWSVAITLSRVVFKPGGASAATDLASPFRPWRGVITGFVVVPPTAARSREPEIHDDDDAEEKCETLVHRDELHGTPPATHPWTLPCRSMISSI